jgi:hypothetical protein
MRAVLLTSFLLVSIIGICGCGSSSRTAESTAAETLQKSAVQLPEFKKQCGDPVHFPITDECVRLAGDRGASLRRQSDLTVAVWRSCALIPSSAETIRQELVGKGSSKTALGQKMIGEMERTEQHSDSPCVLADLGDLDCVAGNSEACETARNADPGCMAWMGDNDTQERLHCIDRAVHDSACMVKSPAANSSSHTDSDNSAQLDSSSANYFSDSKAQAEDCRRIEKACLHTFDECANAEDALQAFLKPQKTAPPQPAQ